MPELPKKYVPADHEPRIREKWADSNCFHADPSRVSADRPAYAMLIPPPNVTARLHLGHALNNTLQDILARTHRMRGFETLWMPGTDHAGIATQTVVEKRLIEAEGKRRTEYERDEFVAKVQAWKDEYEQVITTQLKTLGCSCDWERQRFTMDEICARAVREAFFRLFKDGLIYRGKRLVNWDPVTQTALADDEVEMKDVNGSFYYMGYPLVTKDSTPNNPIAVTWDQLKSLGYPNEFLPDDVRNGVGGDDDRAFVTVATTRPETYFGDTAVAVHPRDPRAAAVCAFKAELPLVGRLIPIIEDDYVVRPDFITGEDSGDPKAQMSTGFLKVTPAHDPNDWEIGKRHDLPVINVMAPDASISDQHGWEDTGDAGHKFVGLSREDARKMVVKEFEARGLLEKKVPYAHSVGHSYRSHAAIEPYLSDQWYVKVTDDRLRGAAQSALVADQRTTNTYPPSADVPGDGTMRFYPERYAKTYETWHDNLRDWCISRQLWWGHRIPVWRGSGDLLRSGDAAALGEAAEFMLKMSAEGRIAMQYKGEAMKLDRPDLELDDELSPFFICIRDPDGDNKELIEKLEAWGAVRDPDVLDTWFSSALWPLNTMGWPEPVDDSCAGLLSAFNPSAVLSTARDIITLWVSRMAMFNRYFTSPDGGKTPGQIPFDDVYIHALLQDGEGRKMSKSLGNGIDPIEIVDSHGADAMRFALCKMTTQTQDVRLPVEIDNATGKNSSPKFDEGRNFCTKLWNAARFAFMKLDAFEGKPLEAVAFTDLAPADVWMLSRLAGAIDKIESSIGGYQFSEYAQTMYDLVWRDFCDWYLEAIKPTIETSPGQQAVLKNVLDSILRLLHPVAPFITEVIHEQLRQYDRGVIRELKMGETGDVLAALHWPVAEAGLRNPEAESNFESLQRLTDAIRTTRSQAKVPTKARVTLHCDDITAALIKRGGRVVETLAGVEEITTDAAPDGSVALTFESSEMALSGFADLVDTGAEAKMQEENLTKLSKDIAALEGRLNNPGYTNKAPEHLVQQTRDQLDSKKAERDATMKRIKELA